MARKPLEKRVMLIPLEPIQSYLLINLLNKADKSLNNKL